MVAPLWICMFLLMRQLEEVGSTATGSAGAKLLTHQSHGIKQLYVFPAYCSYFFSQPVMYNHRISQAGRNPWGSLSPTPWNTCSLCLVAEIERSYSSRGCFQLGQMQVEDNIRLIQQKTNVVRRCDVVLSTCMVSKTDRACLSVGVTSCQPDWLPGEDVPVG